MRYDNYKYIYPPRPSNSIPVEDLDFWDNNSLLCQLKFNGSNCSIYTNGSKVITMNRHNQRLTNFQLSDNEIKEIYSGNGQWMMINGEYLNKNKSDENGESFNHKLIIFDIIVLNNDHLIGKTFSERVSMLDDLYGKSSSDKEYLYGVSKNVYRVKSFENGFKELYDKYSSIDMIEGLVMKRKNAKLEMGLREENNNRSQIKCRKVTKNYKF